MTKLNCAWRSSLARAKPLSHYSKKTFKVVVVKDMKKIINIAAVTESAKVYF